MKRARWLAACSLVQLACASDSEPQPGVDAGFGSADAAPADAGEATPSVPAPVVHSALWQVVTASDDPFGAPPAAVACQPGSFGEEELGGALVFYVRTESCPYLTVTQASRSEIPLGSTLELRLFYFPLTAPEQTTAQLAIRLGATAAWQREIAIPDPGAQLVERWTATEHYPRGTPVFFHVRNHGSNEYALIAIDLLPPSL